MNGASPIIQGWCPGAHRPMESGDGWVVRLRPRAGRLTQEQARGIAALSVKHGNGLIDHSARANVQVRGVTMASHAPLIGGLRALGLLDDSAQAESQRNVTLAPFWAQGDGAYDLALELSAALTAPSAPRLPNKFGFAVDMGAAPNLRDIAGDIRIERAGNAALIYATGAQTGAIVPLADAVPTALKLAQWFADAGGIGADGRGRMAQLLAKGAVLPETFATHAVPAAFPFTPRIGLHTAGALVGFMFGQMQAETLAELAELGPLRITPWRMVLIEGATQMPALPHLITNADDPMLRVIACTGAPACIQAHQPTRNLARALAPHIPQGQICHVSGCAKGCAHPTPAALTLTATPRGFDLVQNGHAGDTPTRAGLAPSFIPQAIHAL
jgi:precorrin-3B synthase